MLHKFHVLKKNGVVPILDQGMNSKKNKRISDSRRPSRDTGWPKRASNLGNVVTKRVTKIWNSSVAQNTDVEIYVFVFFKCLSDQKHEGFTNNHCIIIHEYHQEPGQLAWLASPGMQTCWPRMFRAMKNSWCNSAINISVQYAKPFVIMMLQSQSEVQISKLDCLEANKNWKPWFLPLNKSRRA